jgi:hypothetical protein
VLVEMKQIIKSVKKNCSAFLNFKQFKKIIPHYGEIEIIKTIISGHITLKTFLHI